MRRITCFFLTRPGTLADDLGTAAAILALAGIACLILALAS